MRPQDFEMRTRSEVMVDAERTEGLCYNLGSLLRRYRLGVRTEDSQSSNTGSIPVSATSIHACLAGFSLLHHLHCQHSVNS